MNFVHPSASGEHGMEPQPHATQLNTNGINKEAPYQLPGCSPTLLSPSIFLFFPSRSVLSCFATLFKYNAKFFCFCFEVLSKIDESKNMAADPTVPEAPVPAGPADADEAGVSEHQSPNCLSCIVTA
jgi:hypothetical protein